ncbi:MAG: hemolysin family protein [Bacteroidetes bacterium]|nr:hemolysin family protein [Bacteroidota bacterium]MBU1718384.1 hemolysin family protein [Bacteroidota bacterium]
MELWVVIIISLIFSAFFSGMEIAFLSASRLKIELDRKQGVFYAKIFSRWIAKPSRFIGMVLIGNNISLVSYGIFMAIILEPAISRALPENFHSYSLILIIQTIISTLLILVTAEFIPKTLFRINPVKVLRFFSVPVFLLYYLLFPLVILTSGMATLMLRYLFGIRITSKKPVFGKVDLAHYLEEQGGIPEEEVSDIDHNIQIFQNAMDFSSIKLRECMVPRPEIVAVECSEKIDKLRQKFVETELSRILIYKDSIDNVIGYVHSHRIFKSPANIQEVLLPVQIVPETMTARKLLTMMIQQRQGMAVVVDEFGGTSGLVTMEDIIEEIFGEIEDEYDVEEYIEKQTAENQFLLSGRLEIDYLNDKYAWGIPESDEYETLAGFIIRHYENIPEQSDEITIGKFHFRITQMSDTRIKQVRMTISEKRKS